MSAVLTTEDLKLLVGVLCQKAPDNKTLPSPNHTKLAQAIGLGDRVLCKNRWNALTRKIKNGDYGDMGDIFVDKNPKEAGNKKRPVVEVLADEPVLFPPKKSRGVKKTGKGKSKEKVVKVEDDEEDWDDDEI